MICSAKIHRGALSWSQTERIKRKQNWQREMCFIYSFQTWKFDNLLNKYTMSLGCLEAMEISKWFPFIDCRIWVLYLRNTCHLYSAPTTNENELCQAKKPREEFTKIRLLGWRTENGKGQIRKKDVYKLNYFIMYNVII